MSTVSLALLLAPLVFAGFAALYCLARRLEHYAIVDVAWGLGFAPIALACGWFLDGAPERRLLMTAMASLWSLRLGAHLWKRIAGPQRFEDGRYERLRTHWGDRFPSRMFAFYQMQALALLILSLPFWLASSDPSPELRPVEWAALILWAVALAGESLADAQLAAFKADAGNRGRICDKGLWRYSRHPNYFFEWLVWVSFALFTLASPLGWLALVCPAVMLYLLLQVTGIPQTEAQLLRSKGAAYEDYRARTSAFIPLPRRGGPATP